MKTREEIKAVAVEMVKSQGLINLSRRELCERAGVPDGSFPHIMGCTFATLVIELDIENIDQTNTPVSKSRVPAGLRRGNILDVAVELAVEVGYSNLTREAVADARARVRSGRSRRASGGSPRARAASRRTRC